jgi:methyltransferase-like protein
MDFLSNRMFRQSLLCHADIPVQRRLQPQAVLNSWVRSQAKRVAKPATPQPPGVVQFASKGESTLATDHPLGIAALEIVANEWPRGLAFHELVTAGRDAIGEVARPTPAGKPSEEMSLATTLLRGYGQSAYLVDLHSFHPKMVTEVNTRPVASAMARLEAETRTIVTNMWHERVTLLPIQQRILQLLDGERTIAEVAAQLGDEVSRKELDEHLRWFAYAALLVA